MKMDKKKTITIFACVVIGLLIVSYVVMQSKTSESPSESNTETQTYTTTQTSENDSGNISQESKLDMKTALEIQIEGEIYTISIGENNTVLTAKKIDKNLINKH